MNNQNMSMAPKILTTRWTIKKEWLNNTRNIYEFCSFSERKRLPLLIKKQVGRLCRFLNKNDNFIGLRLFLNRKRFDVIISATLTQAVVYSLLCLFFGKGNNLHILDSVYFNEPGTLRSRIKPVMYKKFLQKVDYIHVNSAREILNYSTILKIDKNKFWFSHYPSHIRNPEIIEYNEGYILSAGKQYRDYVTLISAVKGTGRKLIIVSDKESMDNVDTCDEVTVLYNISGEKYFNLLKKSKFVVIPLSSDFCSCGQIAFLDAMSYGKPVIVARVTGSIDYIEDRKSGLFYEKGNYLDLREKIAMLDNDGELRNKLAQEALAAVKSTFNYDVLVTKFCNFIDEKWQEMNKQEYPD